jgi:hypothetical protein
MAKEIDWHGDGLSFGAKSFLYVHGGIIIIAFVRHVLLYFGLI